MVRSTANQLTEGQTSCKQSNLPEAWQDLHYCQEGTGKFQGLFRYCSKTASPRQELLASATHAWVPRLQWGLWQTGPLETRGETCLRFQSPAACWTQGHARRLPAREYRAGTYSGKEHRDQGCLAGSCWEVVGTFYHNEQQVGWQEGCILCQEHRN